ncbi:class I SAM-dependent methyltransferase [Paenibacillus spongiae]|uniref:Phospholipid methyltransferase n=1 Tax=Paenibacillus spongiae TaxID=2909671 RepID=A0ABY5S145_9BACL|nr:phospholipid methyltransferase [Paenibacillus spongiae]UVI27572.1 phospholipid methyltransferase [Paenibacillus spongiae]
MRKPSFLGEFLADSLHVGSVVPSSDFLTRKMLPVTIPWRKINRIAELGPGTGVFTKYVERERSPNSRFYLFERNEAFRNVLKRKFPELAILDDALRLGEVVQETGLKFDLIISGLPFANFDSSLQELLFHDIYNAMADNGTFVAFQYTPLLRRKFQAHFPIVDAGYTWLNVPPAWVFRCRKRRASAHRKPE